MSETLEIKIGASDAGLEATLKTVQSELTKLETKVKGGDLSFKELEQTMKKISQTQGLEKKLQDMGKEAAGASPKVGTLSTDINAMGQKSKEAGEKGETSLAKIGIAAGVAGAAVKIGMMAVELATAAATKTIASFGSALDMGGRLNDLADRTGIAVDKVMLLERAFQNSGVGADSLGPIINKMQKAIVDAGDGTSGAAVAFANLGLSLSAISALSPEEQLRTIGKAIAGVEDPAMRASLSMEIFGKSGGALNQVFANFDGELQTAKNQLGSLPDIMKASSSQFDRISDNLVVVGGKFIEFAAGIIDKVKPALDAITTGLSMIDAAKIGQELGDFFVGAGSGMKMFQASIDAFSTGNLTDGFKLAWQAIVAQAMDTANSIWTYMVTAFKTVGDFIKDQFDSKGPLVMVITSTFDFVAGYIKKVVTGTLFDAFTDLGPAFSRIADGLKQSSEAGAQSAELALQRIPVAAELAAEKASDSMGNIPDQFKANMADVPPLFDTVTKKQDEVVDANKKIANSVLSIKPVLSEIEQKYEALRKAIDAFDKASDKESKDRAAQQVKKVKDSISELTPATSNSTSTGANKSAAEDERAANAERARQAKLKESAAIKREEVELQIKISNAIAAGDTKEAERLRGAKELNRTIQDMVKSGMGEGEATKLANEMGRAGREAERVKSSFSTNIDEKIKAKDEADFLDKGGVLQKKADDAIAAGQYNQARKYAQDLDTIRLDNSVKGVGASRDRRNSADILADYYGPSGASAMLSQNERNELIRQARDEGKFKDFSKITDFSKKGLDRYADLNSESSDQKDKGKNNSKIDPPSSDPGAKNQNPSQQTQKQTLDDIVKKILDLVQKIEPKLPVAALSA